MDTEFRDLDPKPETSTKHNSVSQERSSSSAKVSMDLLQMQMHKEEDVGITEFISPDLPGFTGVLKKRFVFIK